MKADLTALRAQRDQLVLQRYQAKDVVEQCERRLDTVMSVLNILEKMEENGVEVPKASEAPKPE